MMDKKVDFGWGNPYFLLEILNSKYQQTLAPHDIGNMSYAPDDGIKELQDMTREVIKQTTGLEYKHIIITNGATQAISSILKYKSGQRGFEDIMTTEYGYPYYRDMISNCGIKQWAKEDLFKGANEGERPHEWGIAGNPFYLVDSPSNPQGIQYEGCQEKTGQTFWDAVYHNRIYNADSIKWPWHIAQIGSYSKILGLTGARVGWIATNDDFFYDRIKDVSLKDTGTVSIPSQKLIIDILKKIDLDEFMNTAKEYLNDNRTEFQKIEYLFDNQPVQKVGMFYCAHADKKTLDLLDKCGIIYLKLTDDYIRLSMGQTREVVKEGINRLLKEDRK